jgi:hypothetical protein
MQDHSKSTTGHAKCIPWNKGKLPGAKPPLQPKHVWAIRTKLQVEGCKRDLALFYLAVDSKLRGCDIVSRDRNSRASRNLKGRAGSRQALPVSHASLTD